jgi:hypothetical protein
VSRRLGCARSSATPSLEGRLVAFSGTDAGSTLLFSAALLVVAIAVFCMRRAIDARGLRGRSLWVGRALGLLGAAVAISFPGVLYQEIAMLIGQGRALTYDIEAALWYEFRMMPLVVVPALVAFRWTRLGAVLFLLDGAFGVYVALVQPFGVVYPEAAGGWTGLPALDAILQPAFIPAVLLLVGSTRISPLRAAAEPK